MLRQTRYEFRSTDDDCVRDPPGYLHAVGLQIANQSHLVRYVAFAALAIFVNLFWQAAVLSWVGGFWLGIYIAIAAGNAAGLLFKYLVDKRWVYKDTDQTIAGTSRKFALYTAFGIGTTLLFWAVELTFHYIFGTVLMTNVGAIIGLTIGYAVKYNLDKHFTFRDKL